MVIRNGEKLESKINNFTLKPQILMLKKKKSPCINYPCRWICDSCAVVRSTVTQWETNWLILEGEKQRSRPVSHTECVQCWQTEHIQYSPLFLQTYSRVLHILPACSTVSVFDHPFIVNIKSKMTRIYLWMIDPSLLFQKNIL